LLSKCGCCLNAVENIQIESRLALQGWPIRFLARGESLS
jgi:hypothetical protein